MMARNCPFCGELQVLRETTSFMLVKALGKEDDYLVIPKRHVVQLDALLEGWGEELAALVAYVRDEVWHSPKEGHYNVSLNVGRRAGRRIKHLHWWLIDRQRGPIEGLGLATLAQLQRYFPGFIKEGMRYLNG